MAELVVAAQSRSGVFSNWCRPGSRHSALAFGEGHSPAQHKELKPSLPEGVGVVGARPTVIWEGAGPMVIAWAGKHSTCLVSSPG